MKDGVYYGIDFGTTNTSVFMYKYDEIYGVRTAKYGTDGKDIYPFSSCIAIPRSGSRNYIFGREVRDRLNELADDHEIVSSFKSFLGTDKIISVGGESYNGCKLAAMFLKYVKETVSSVSPEPFEEAVFSIPVDFSENARKELMNAAESVGISVKGFVSESSAAYISKTGAEELRSFSRILVIDWGGGTLDLSILNVGNKIVSEEAVYGIKFGGDDIDHELSLRMMPKIYPGKSFDDLESDRKDRLMRNIEAMKIQFSEDDDYDLILGPGAKPVTIDYADFEEIVSPLVVKYVLTSVDKIMANANVKPDGIDAVILAGGSSSIRPFYESIIKIFGEKKVLFDESYQWMVAKGAAITSAADCKFVLCDDLCVLLSDDDIFTLFEGGVNKVGDKCAPVSFSLTDDSTDAHFIFTDSDKKPYARISVKSKGYYNEVLILSAVIEKEQTAHIEIENPDIENGYKKICEINKLRFLYDMSELEDEVL